MNNKKKCLVIGDLNIDLILNDFEIKPSLGSEVLANNSFLDIGGSGGIFSAVISQLGIETYIISKIGKDHYGDFLTRKLKRFGVNIDFLTIDRIIAPALQLIFPTQRINTRFQP